MRCVSTPSLLAVIYVSLINALQLNGDSKPNMMVLRYATVSDIRGCGLCPPSILHPKIYVLSTAICLHAVCSRSSQRKFNVRAQDLRQPPLPSPPSLPVHVPSTLFRSGFCDHLNIWGLDWWKLFPVPQFRQLPGGRVCTS